MCYLVVEMPVGRTVLSRRRAKDGVGPLQIGRKRETGREEERAERRERERERDQMKRDLQELACDKLGGHLIRKVEGEG